MSSLLLCESIATRLALFQAAPVASSADGMWMDEWEDAVKKSKLCELADYSSDELVNQCCADIAPLSRPSLRAAVSLLVRCFEGDDALASYMPLLHLAQVSTADVAAYLTLLAASMYLEVRIRQEAERRKPADSGVISILLSDLIQDRIAAGGPEAWRNAVLHCICSYPRGLNLRNLVAHGFLLPRSETDSGENELVLAATTLASAALVAVAPSSIFEAPLEVVSLPVDCTSIKECAELLLAQGHRGLALMLLFPQLEADLRHLHCSLNHEWLGANSTHDHRVAQDSVRYHTFEHLLCPQLQTTSPVESTEGSSVPNTVFIERGKNESLTASACVEWFGLLLCESGPKVRDKLFHAKWAPEEVPSDVMGNVLHLLGMGGEGSSLVFGVGHPIVESSSSLQTSIGRANALLAEWGQEGSCKLAGSGMTNTGLVEGSGSPGPWGSWKELASAWKKQPLAIAALLESVRSLRGDEGWDTTQAAVAYPSSDVVAGVFLSRNFRSSARAASAVYRAACSLVAFVELLSEKVSSMRARVTDGSARESHVRSLGAVDAILPSLGDTLLVAFGLLVKMQNALHQVPDERLCAACGKSSQVLELAAERCSGIVKSGTKPLTLCLVVLVTDVARVAHPVRL